MFFKTITMVVQAETEEGLQQALKDACANVGQVPVAEGVYEHRAGWYHVSPTLAEGQPDLACDEDAVAREDSHIRNAYEHWASESKDALWFFRSPPAALKQERKGSDYDFGPSVGPNSQAEFNRQWHHFLAGCQYMAAVAPTGVGASGHFRTELRLIRNKLGLADWATGAQILSAINRLQNTAVSLPEGYAVVRKELTPAMTAAARPWIANIQHMRAVDQDSAIQEAYRAAVAAQGVVPVEVISLAEGLFVRDWAVERIDEHRIRLTSHPMGAHGAREHYVADRRQEDSFYMTACAMLKASR